MNERLVRQAQRDGPAAVVRELLGQHAVVEPTTGGIAVARRVAILEREAPEIVQAAKAVGVEIEHLGIAALPPAPMYYNGAGGIGWVLGPATTPEDAVVPRRAAQELSQLRDGAGIYMSMTFVAHEVAPERAERIRTQVAGPGLELALAQATELVGPIPPPADSVALGEQMAQRSRQVVAGLRRAGKLVVGAVTIPVVATGAVLAEVATLDPIILGAIPAASEKPGAPASWYRLVSWDW